MTQAMMREIVVRDTQLRVPQAETAAILGVTVGRVSQILKAAKEDAVKRCENAADEYLLLIVDAHRRAMAKGLELLENGNLEAGRLLVSAAGQLAKLIGVAKDHDASERAAEIAAAISAASLELRKSLIPGDE